MPEENEETTRGSSSACEDEKSVRLKSSRHLVGRQQPLQRRKRRPNGGLEVAGTRGIYKNVPSTLFARMAIAMHRQHERGLDSLAKKGQGFWSMA